MYFMNFQLESGFIVYVVDGQKAVFNSMQINDGNWHNLEIIWQNTGGVRFVLDHGIRSVIKTLNAKLQGQFVGKIQLGNFNEDLTNVDENTGFKGCIKVIIIIYFVVLKLNFKKLHCIKKLGCPNWSQRRNYCIRNS